MGAKKAFGAQSVAELLNHVDAETRERLLKQLAKDDPAAYANVQERMFSFEDLMKLPDERLRALLAEVPQSKMALALRNASPELKAKILGNLSKLGAENLKSEIESMGPQRLSLVQTAQREIVEVAKNLN